MEPTESICSTTCERIKKNREESSESSTECEFEEGLTIKLEEQARILEKHTKDIYEKIIDELQKQTRNYGKKLHISYCISSDIKASREIYNTLVQLVNGRNDGIYLGTQSYRDWHALSSFLELERGHIESIVNYNPENRVDKVLRVISQYKDKTMTDLVEVLIKMKAFDILYSLSKPLSNLAKQVNEGNEPERSGLYRPKNIHLNLPKELLTYDCPEESSKEEEHSLCFEDLSVNNDTPVLKPDTNDFTIFSGSSQDTCLSRGRINKKILLTYTQDGICDAVMIRCEILKRMPQVSCDITFLSLQKIKHKIQDAYQANKYVALLCDEADYIIPIMTPQYLKQIRENHKVNLQADNLDHELVRLVYERQGTMTCLNFERNKVRGFLPKDVPNVENMIQEFKKLTYNKLFNLYKTVKNLNELIDVILYNPSSRSC